MSAKKCAGCEKEKPISDYSRDKSRADGLAIYCRACRSTYRAQSKAGAVAGAGTTIQVDFASDSYMHEWLMSESRTEYRTPDAQIRYMLSKSIPKPN